MWKSFTSLKRCVLVKRNKKKNSGKTGISSIIPLQKNSGKTGISSIIPLHRNGQSDKPFLVIADEVLFVICTAHTPDNSFLGFVVPKSKLMNVTEKENYALIIGKESRYLLVRHVCYFLLKAIFCERWHLREDFRGTGLIRINLKRIDLIAVAVQKNGALCWDAQSRWAQGRVRSLSATSERLLTGSTQ